MVPNSRQGLIDYCLRNLGFPVIQINVDDDQVSDRIDEALQFYQEYHSDGTIRAFFKHQITQDDINNRFIPIPEEVLTVTRVLPFTSSTSSVNMFDARYQMMLNDMFNIGFAGNVANFVQTMQYLNTLDMVINGLPQVNYSRHADKLFIYSDWERMLRLNEFVMIEAYRVIDPEDAPKIYNDMYLKRYATALIKRQWGINLKKFEGIEMPGGVTLNGQQIFDEAQEEIRALEEEMRLNWEEPVHFMTG
jgi:hypothetical protein